MSSGSIHSLERLGPAELVGLVRGLLGEVERPGTAVRFEDQDVPVAPPSPAAGGGQQPEVKLQRP
jgi:hypothetical protein